MNFKCSRKRNILNLSQMKHWNKNHSCVKEAVSRGPACCVQEYGCSLHALKPKLWSIKHEGVRPWKMGASLLKPGLSFREDRLKISTLS